MLDIKRISFVLIFLKMIHTSFLPHDRSAFFSTKPYWDMVKTFCKHELIHDGDDITSNFCIEENTQKNAFVTAKEEGILAGKDELSFFLDTFFPEISYHWNKNDGESFENKELLLHCSGNARQIMKMERVFLNILSRLSGIATTTQLLQDLSTNIPLSATRKTQWGFLDKKAVCVGGGLSHRIGLFDGFLIKENHIFSSNGGLISLLKKFQELPVKDEKIFPKRFFEIEVETDEDFSQVFSVFYTNPEISHIPKVIMLDNFSPESISLLLKNYPTKTQRHQKKIFLEASGGIKQKNLKEYQNTSVDVLSLGTLTNAVQPIDISLRIHE